MDIVQKVQGLDDVLIRSLKVKDILILMSVDISDPVILKYIISNIVIGGKTKFKGDELELITSAIIENNPILQSNEPEPTEVTDAEVSKRKTKSQIASIRFQKQILVFTQQGHSNILDYPYTLYDTLLTMAKDSANG